MLGMLQRNEADLALGPFQMTKDRGEDFSFSQAVHSTQVHILSKRYPVIHFNGFYASFSTEVCIQAFVFPRLFYFHFRVTTFRSRSHFTYNILMAIMTPLPLKANDMTFMTNTCRNETKCRSHPLECELFHIFRFISSITILWDIAEMLQIELDPAAITKYHRFLWRDNNKAADIYEFNRAVFGVHFFPFLAQYLSTVWKVAGMHARKWITNSREVLKEIPKEGQLSNFSLDKDRLPILNTLAVCAIRIRIRIRRCFREEASGADAYQIHKKESTSINVCGENAEPERLLFIFWCGCSFITMSFYRTVLLSHLTVPKYAKSMESLADLAFNDIPTLIEKDGSTYTTLKVIAKLLIKIHFLGWLYANTIECQSEMNSEYAKIILEKREKDESIDKISAMTSDWNNLIMEKRYSALVSWSTVTMIFNEDLKSSSVCHFSVSKGFIFQGDLMLAFPKNSNLISHFNKRIPWLRKFGIHDYWWNKVFYKTKKCSQNRKPIDMQQNRKLKFEDIIGLLCFWATGILLSICVFVLEISVHRYRIFKNNQ
ncbi:hypothetical protein GQR58_007653 [Nymphon striatum]|nr:hypothetical protein GQR58_007653 [Nymphon striatum]